MVNTNMFEFKHPKYYKELRKRNTAVQSSRTDSQQSDQVISCMFKADGQTTGRAPGPGLQAASYKLSSFKRQAASPKLQASSFKPQATSSLIFKPS